MKRRNFVASVLAGGVVAAPTLLAQHEHDKEEVSGPQASATVSFGQWRTDFQPPLNRFNPVPPGPPPPAANHDHLVPFDVQIKAGGSVNFIISGLHIPAIYAPGTELEDINGTLTIPIPGAPVIPPPNGPFPGVVNDPLNRVYWGVNPFSLTPSPLLDRIEAVTFVDPGTYLVVCTFMPHFQMGMHGYVKVLE
jgi:hypothetical protein